MDDLNHWRDEVTGIIARALCSERPHGHAMSLALKAEIARIDHAFAGIAAVTSPADPLAALIAHHAASSVERQKEIVEKLRAAFGGKK